MKKLLYYTFFVSIPVVSILFWNWWFSDYGIPYQDYVPWEFIVKYKVPTHNNTKWKRISTFDVSTLENEMQESLDDDQKLSVTDTLPNLNMAFISVEWNQDTQDIINRLKNNDNIEYIEPNHIRYIDSINADDSQRDLLWALDNQWQTIDNGTYITTWVSWEDIDWVKMWDIFSGSFSSSGPWSLVWVIDLWVNYNHEDLKDNMRGESCILSWSSITCKHWYDFLNDDNDPMPWTDQSHWTHIAGTIAAKMNNWKWIIWVNPNTKIASLKAWEWNLSSSAIIKAVDFATENWIKIINASYWWAGYNSWEYEAMLKFKNAWWIFVAGAGNNGSNNDYNPFYPSSYDLNNIIAVAATTQTWDLADFSCYWPTSVDVWAPWVNILSSAVDSHYNPIYYFNFRENKTFDAITGAWFKLYPSEDNFTWTKSYSLRLNYQFCQSWAYVESPSIDITEAIWDKLWMTMSITCANSLSEDREYLWIEINTWAWYHEIKRHWTGTIRKLDLGYVTSDTLKYKIVFHKDEASSWFSCGIYRISIPWKVWWPDNFYQFSNWTSMATPHVAWLVSLAWMFRPDLSAQEIKQAIMDNGDPLPSLDWKTVSGKRINAYNTLVALDNYAPIPPILTTPTSWQTFTWEWTNFSINFEWQPTTDSWVWVSGYILELSQNEWFNSLITWITLESTQSNISITSWNYYWRVKAFDKKWNTWNYSKINQFTILETNNQPTDNTSPTIWLTNSSNTWRNSNISITLTANDEDSWLSWWKAKYYWSDSNSSTLTQCRSNGTWYSSWESITYSSEGISYLYVCAYDNAGNSNISSGVYKVDKIPPTISLNNSSNSWKNENIPITLNSNDETSWLSWNAKYFRSNSSGTTLNECRTNGSGFNNNEIIIDSREWTKYLYICAYDNAGNSNFGSWIYKLDKSAPIISINYSSTNNCTNSDVTVFVSATDGISWIPNDWYSRDNKQTRWLSTWITLNDNWTGIVFVKDNAWNTTWIEYNVSWINSDTLVITPNNVIWWECTTLTGNISVNNSSWWSNISYSREDFWTWTTTWEFTYTLMWTWIRTWSVTISDSTLNQTVQTNIIYTWTDTQPSLTITDYTYSNQIKSTNGVNIWNIVTLLWANDWACWNSSEFINATYVFCDNWSASIINNELIINAPNNSEWSSICSITFTDDEGNTVIWKIAYSYNTKTSWGWGGGWWGGWSKKTNIDDIKDLIHEDDNDEGNVTNKIYDLNDLIHENDENNNKKVVKVDSFLNPINSQNINNNSVIINENYNWFLIWEPWEILSNGYTREINNAYHFAYINWITTMNNIETANMNWTLKRIEMAKMLSQYAINVLWKQPNTSKNIKFNDVPLELNQQYNYWITKAYQLWIMWQNVNNFRPFDIVTRAEFATALSRLLYWTKDWTSNYYSTHLDKLFVEWIISNTDPNMHELRWYVMLMLMRSYM